jgi:hypothetical protein
MTDGNEKPHQIYPYPDEETRTRCLDRLRETNCQLDLYNLFLDDAIAQIDGKLRQQKQSRLSQKVKPAE